ncbi:MAG: hypothetical protein K2W96_25765, partial [Gemmataceae bacterium]|nr:hypothetical protein [Gemmataceae bacterium]
GDFLSRSAKAWSRPECAIEGRLLRDWRPGASGEERAEELIAHSRRMRRLADEAGRWADEAERIADRLMDPRPPSGPAAWAAEPDRGEAAPTDEGP